MRLLRGSLACLMLLGLLACQAGAAPLPLKRGVGLHEWLNWSPLAADGSYRWPPYRTEKDWLGGSRPLADWPAGDQFRRIRSMGFDFVRLSVDPGPLLASKGARRKQALAVLERAVGKITAAGLKVVFNLHGNSQVVAYGQDVVNESADSAAIAGYRDMVRATATMLARVGTDKVAIEPFNEPAHYPCDASGTEDWQRIMAATVADIRSVSREMTIVATGACGGNISGLVDLDPDFDDADILYSFHMYEPHSFTHQRSEDAKGFSSGMPWPADGSTPEVVIAGLRTHMTAAGLDDVEQGANITALAGGISEYFDQNWGYPQLQARIGEAVGWARNHRIPTERLFMGEFGVLLMSPDGRRGAFDGDRLRYLAALRTEAERFHIPWAIWEYSNPYGMSVIVDRGPALPDGALLGVLGLPVPGLK